MSANFPKNKTGGRRSCDGFLDLARLDEEEEIEEEELFNDPRLMTHMDEFVEEAALPGPKKKRSSSWIVTCLLLSWKTS